ncbi:MAG: response regulator [Planctomycetes bacterium]|nr:response regulator [Planctomycetota bacterium]
MNRPAQPLRIAVADHEPDTRLFLQELLSQLGHAAVAVAESGRQLAEQCHATRPDLVITDIHLPDMDGVAAGALVNRERPVPVILITGNGDFDLLASAGGGPIMACLTKPVKPVDLQAAITLGLRHFEHFQQLRKENADLRRTLEDRKIIERAKGAIMKRLRVDEEEAFRKLRKAASDQNRKLVEMAQVLLKAEETFQELDGR